MGQGQPGQIRAKSSVRLRQSPRPYKFRGVFTTRAQNTGGSTFNWEFLANGTSLGTFGLKGGNENEIKVPVENIVAGWNTLSWKYVSGWVNCDWHKFTLVPAPSPFMMIVR